MLSAYIKQISQIHNRGDAREESFYSTLESLLKNYSESNLSRKINITTLPKKTEAGNPDFRVWDGKQKIIGYVEAKAPDVTNLDNIETTDQLERYLSTFPNVILTNFLEFRLYRDGNLTDHVTIARPLILQKLKTEPPLEKEDEFYELLNKFFSFSFPAIRSARSLATELAKRTRFLRDEVVDKELKINGNDRKNFITGFYEAFKKYLISGLTEKEFADLYSQTIAYGLFAARTRADEDFNRKLAYDKIPRTIGILREVFRFISLSDVPAEMEWIIDDISEVLAVTDVKKLLHDYFHEGKGKDPIIHFYETFLAEYDPKTREKRGVYYTPEPVVSYIVRSLNIILKEKFGKPDGFADRSVTVLDPAAGTLTFLAEAAKLAVSEFESKYGSGGKDSFIKEHILRNFYAFELMMAPYAIGHIKMSFLLEELGYKLSPDDRFKLYLTNTLEMEELEQSDLPGMSSLSEESHLAGKVKKDQPILVILGNPPYSGTSANTNPWIDDLLKKDIDGIQSYYKVDGKPLGEKNPKWLQDDYVKFIKFSQWKIEKSGIGVIGMITNNSYLSGLIHRGMRKKLLDTFDEIHILNLHGNSRIGEKSPDGSPDENVFDIQQGVAISIFEKKENQKFELKLYYQDLWGLRENKYNFLEKNNLNSTDWNLLQSTQPNYFYVIKDFSLSEGYENFIQINNILSQFSSGVTTHRDHFVTGFSKAEVKQKLLTFVGELPDEVIAQSLNLKETADFNLKNSRIKVKKSQWIDYIVEYTYRPFDKRHICYLEELIDRNRFDIMQNFLKNNIGIVVMRQYLYDSVKSYNYVFCVDEISDRRLFISNRGAGFVFPLYIYNRVERIDLFSKISTNDEKDSNINPKLTENISAQYNKSLTPEEIFYYIYCVLYSNIYRTKYAEFLKIDFPRVPFTRDYQVFSKLSEFGNKLVDLHLLKSKELDSPVARFQGKGDDRVDKIKYEDNKVYINKDQHFEGVEEEVYEYQIGGYQVCNKWLKDRKDRKLSLDDIMHYCKVVTSLKKTIEIQKEIDLIYSDVEKDLIEF